MAWVSACGRRTRTSENWIHQVENVENDVLVRRAHDGNQPDRLRNEAVEGKAAGLWIFPGSVLLSHCLAAAVSSAVRLNILCT